MSSTTPVGTIAYIIDEEALLVRVNKGWQYIAVSLCTRIGIHSDNYYYTYICIRTLYHLSCQLGTLVPIATPSPPTTAVPPQQLQPRPDMQASNLLTNGQDFEDGPTVGVWPS